ncbi:hypothetical protein GCM10010446_46970 [Streptomyces enissocaesilis]|uniref:Carbohydrate kinase FGGY N-terminal domain-containing protein n=1 Tax=Streptomyces enissocaesilis TaxID=332589 RepID=A0ABN3XHY5_9ACTN
MPEVPEVPGTLYVGVDVGTSLVKAAAFDASGREVAVESRPVALDVREGRVEQDMDEVYAAVVDVLATLTASVPGPDGSAAVELAGLTGQGDGVWLVDARGQPVRPAISWMDGRAHALLDEWMASGVFTAVYRRTGSAMFPGCPGPVLAWLDHRVNPARPPRGVPARRIPPRHRARGLRGRLRGVRAALRARRRRGRDRLPGPGGPGEGGRRVPGPTDDRGLIVSEHSCC